MKLISLCLRLHRTSDSTFGGLSPALASSVPEAASVTIFASGSCFVYRARCSRMACREVPGTGSSRLAALAAAVGGALVGGALAAAAVGGASCVSVDGTTTGTTKGEVPGRASLVGEHTPLRVQHSSEFSIHLSSSFSRDHAERRG